MCSANWLLGFKSDTLSHVCCNRGGRDEKHLEILFEDLCRQLCFHSGNVLGLVVFPFLSQRWLYPKNKRMFEVNREKRSVVADAQTMFFCIHSKRTGTAGSQDWDTLCAATCTHLQWCDRGHGVFGASSPRWPSRRRASPNWCPGSTLCHVSPPPQQEPAWSLHSSFQDVSVCF